MSCSNYEEHIDTDAKVTVSSIRKQLKPRLKKLGAVIRISPRIFYIRPSWVFGWQGFSIEDQVSLSSWVEENGYTNIGGKPFLPNDSVFAGSFYIKI